MKLKDISGYIQYGDPEADIYVLSAKKYSTLRSKAIAFDNIKDEIKRAYKIIKEYEKE